MGLRSHGMADMLAWARQRGVGEAAMQQRKGLLQAATHLLAEDEMFEFTPGDLIALGKSGLLSNIELIDIARKLESRQKYPLSIELRLLALERDPTPQPVDVLFIANLAEVMAEPPSKSSTCKWRGACRSRPAPRKHLTPSSIALSDCCACARLRLSGSG
ncbi:hypothetical protein [Verrucomicrobium spinosum]|uniref:hypothetical protein n=1 Tax=Verrucomicrobium spinosum TaxID=2736 RepID=UPI0012E1B5CE|nr:hypothetical protein [Verrucomicrobium spinosum]